MAEAFTVVSSLKCYDCNLPRRCNDAIWHKVVFKQLGRNEVERSRGVKTHRNVGNFGFEVFGFLMNGELFEYGASLQFDSTK